MLAHFAAASLLAAVTSALEFYSPPLVEALRAQGYHVTFEADDLEVLEATIKTPKGKGKSGGAPSSAGPAPFVVPHHWMLPRPHAPDDETSPLVLVADAYFVSDECIGFTGVVEADPRWRPVASIANLRVALLDVDGEPIAADTHSGGATSGRRHTPPTAAELLLPPELLPLDEHWVRNEFSSWFLSAGGYLCRPSLAGARGASLLLANPALKVARVVSVYRDYLFAPGDEDAPRVYGRYATQLPRSACGAPALPPSPPSLTEAASASSSQGLHTSPLNQVAAYLIFRDDVHLAPAYLDWYRALGVTHFFFFNNGADARLVITGNESPSTIWTEERKAQRDALLSELASQPDVTILTWALDFFPRTPGSDISHVYNHAIYAMTHAAVNRLGRCYNWIVQLDLDEYLMPPSEHQLPPADEVLRHHQQHHQTAGAAGKRGKGKGSSGSSSAPLFSLQPVAAAYADNLPTALNLPLPRYLRSHCLHRVCMWDSLWTAVSETPDAFTPFTSAALAAMPLVRAVSKPPEKRSKYAYPTHDGRTHRTQDAGALLVAAAVAAAAGGESEAPGAPPSSAGRLPLEAIFDTPLHRLRTAALMHEDLDYKLAQKTHTAPIEHMHFLHVLNYRPHQFKDSATVNETASAAAMWARVGASGGTAGGGNGGGGHAAPLAVRETRVPAVLAAAAAQAGAAHSNHDHHHHSGDGA